VPEDNLDSMSEALAGPIDTAPELGEKWGRASRDAMRRIVAGERLHCELTGDRSYDRSIGVCRLDEGRNCQRYSGGRYADNETERSRTLPVSGYCRPR
jgi:micrococcal nuclease